MSLIVRFEAEASAELLEAARWYQGKRSGLGLDFLAAFDRTVNHISAWPAAGTPVDGVPADLSVRQAPVRRFPYRLVYVVHDDVVRILAVAHERRHPDYWRTRTPPA